MFKAIRKKYYPALFQGDLRKQNYFEGWYFKQVSEKKDSVLAFIPGISLSKDPHAFVQMINGLTGETKYFRYDIEDFSAGEKEFEVKIGPNYFSGDRIEIDLKDGKFKINGTLRYRKITPYPKSFLSPGIMGWFSFVPFMECYHGVVSIDHEVSGTLNYNGRKLSFDKGRGYIEKDWGRSMPESWVWLHSNTFEEKNISFMLSVAKIPWLGNYFTGLLCFLYIKGKLYRFMTYTGAKYRIAKQKEKVLEMEITGSGHKLKIFCEQYKAGKLKAPVSGNMERQIKESVDSKLAVTLYDKKDKLLFSGLSVHTGCEIVGEIESLSKD